MPQLNLIGNGTITTKTSQLKPVQAYSELIAETHFRNEVCAAR